MPETSNDLVRARLLELAAYLASAARGNVDEATGYGPYRLLEGFMRVVRLLDELGLSHPELNNAASDVAGAAMKIIGDPELARETADKVLGVLAVQIASAGAGDAS
jgi:hypothetical protein